jgi:hypothetical protein
MAALGRAQREAQHSLTVGAAARPPATAAGPSHAVQCFRGPRPVC